MSVLPNNIAPNNDNWRNTIAYGQYNQEYQNVGAKPVSNEFTRPSNATVYDANDVVGVNKAVSGASNTTPIIITSTAHGFVDRQPVTIASVGGTTAANANWFAKVLDANRFALYSDALFTIPSIGNGAYTSGGTIAALGILPNFARCLYGTGLITKVRLMTDLSTDVKQYRIHFFHTAVTAILDNDIYTLLYANRAARIGFIDLPAATTEGTGSDAATSLWTPGMQNPLFLTQGPLEFSLPSTNVTRDIYYVVETKTAGTPKNPQLYYVEVTPENN